MNRLLRRFAELLTVLSMVGTLAGCGDSGIARIRTWVAQVEKRPAGKILQVPQPMSYHAFVYRDESLRSPFLPAVHPGRNVRPNFHRQKQYLERFPLDALSLVGELTFGGETYALIEDPKGMVHHVIIGNYLGQNNGRVVAILPGEIRIREIVSNGSGGWQKKTASLSLSQKSGG